MDRLKKFNKEEKELKKKFGLNISYKTLKPLKERGFEVYRITSHIDKHFFLKNKKNQKLVAVLESSWSDGPGSYYPEKYLIAIPGTLFSKWILGQLKGY